jgi:hypothetical protein
VLGRYSSSKPGFCFERTITVTDTASRPRVFIRMRPDLDTWVLQKAFSPAVVLASGRHSTISLRSLQELAVLTLLIRIALPTFFGTGLHRLQHIHRHRVGVGAGCPLREPACPNRHSLLRTEVRDISQGHAHALWILGLG